ncbi:hypothetical protein EI94DRAFT_1806311 [Lactarius quietus]|nr:hypothetical protein EI94DRAFT_1806311 [Lactarius quietus]
MLFNKSIISFFAAIALASSVAAAVAPNPNANTNTPTTGSQNQQANAQNVVPTCATGTPTCCNSIEPFSSLTPAQQTELRGLDSNLNTGLNVGLNCAAAGSQGCASNLKPLCCDAIQTTPDLPSVAANCVASS